MPNYSNGKIYLVRFYDNDKLVYIGSTTQSLAVRFGGHKKKSNFSCSLHRCIDSTYNGDWSKCYIELLEIYDCQNKEELNKKEGEIIRHYKADENYEVINKYIAGRTDKQYRKDSKDKTTEYYQANKEKLKKHHHDYYQENKETIVNKKIEYYQANKEKKIEYYQANKEKRKLYAAQYYKNLKKTATND
jgi:hypothetical protein